jgi:3,4-dihydroxy 2-butanone 4-phosphate synthase/GTP cyclohydrolase II
MVIVVDDADRENEGDLVVAGEKVTPAAINFMAKFGRGLICVPATSDRLIQLGIDRMVVQNRESFRTDFQVSVDAADGITTGHQRGGPGADHPGDGDPTAVPADLVQPGHVFPLRAKPGGVLQRAGHTEAAVDLARLAGCRPMGVICEIMDDDGTMMRLPKLRRFAKKHRSEDLFDRGPHPVPADSGEAGGTGGDDPDADRCYGDFQLTLYRAKTDGKHHLALVYGDVAGNAGRMCWCGSTANA